MKPTITVMNFLLVAEELKNAFILEEMNNTYQEYNNDKTQNLLDGMAEVLALSIDNLIIFGALTTLNLANAIDDQIDSWEKSQHHADSIMRKLTQE